MDTLRNVCDSVATCANSLSEECWPIVKEAGTTWQDVSIVFLVCLTLLIIALYAICKYYRWKKYEKVASAEAAKEKRKNDVEDRQWKLSVDKETHDLKRKEEKEDYDRKQKEELQDRDRKRRVDLQDKLLCYLKDLAEIERDADGNEITKYNNESMAYKAMLEKMINEFPSNIVKTNDKKA